MGLVVELVKAKQQIAVLEKENAEYKKQLVFPPPPTILGSIGNSELFTILYGAFDIAPNLGSSHWDLTSNEEYQRFLDWYRDTHPYVLDEYDCNVFAWEQVAFAMKWMNNTVPWGYIWAYSNDPDYAFPEHGFCFILNYKKELCFCDELEVAAPRDKFMPIYPVVSSLVIVN